VLRKIHLLLVFTFFVFSSAGVCNALFFRDDFRFLNSSRWYFTQNNGTISVVDGEYLSLGSTASSFPYVLSRGDVFPSDGNFVFKTRFKFLLSAANGDGISIGHTGLSGGYNLSQFAVWNDAGKGIHFYYNDFSSPEQGGCVDYSIARELAGRRVAADIGLENGKWYLFKAKRESGYFLIEIYDDETQTLIFDFNPGYGGQCIPHDIWLGNYLTAGWSLWSPLIVDYVEISSLGEAGGTRNKIIIVPGMGASWNEKAMVLNQAVEDKEWRMTPLVKNYDGLVTALEGKGLAEGSDFWVWNYDWRRPVTEIVDKLDDFVEEKIPTGEKVDVVGHSLGGLTARLWSQKETEGGGDKVGKILSLGSPHLGAVKAYEAWNGAKISDNFDFSTVALKILLQLQKKNFETEVATLRNYAPVVKDLQPVFDFLKKNGKVVGWAAAESKNQFLADKNLSIAGVFDVNLAMVGTGVATKEWINLTDRSVFDRVLGVWPEGRPMEYVLGEGDGTVLKKSARLGDDDYWETASNHGELVDRAIGKIFEELELGEYSGGSIGENNWEGKRIFYVGSPVRMKVNCGGVEKMDEEGWVVMEPGNDDCQTEIEGTEAGVYHLVTGTVGDDESWRYYEKETGAGEKDEVGGVEYLWLVVKRDLEELKKQYGENSFLNKGLAAVEGKKVDDLVAAVFGFRKEKKENAISGRIIGNVEILLAEKNKGISEAGAKALYTKLLQDKSTVERITRLYTARRVSPTLWWSTNYRMMEEEELRAKDGLNLKEWSSVAARSILGSKFSQNIWYN